MRPLSVWAGLAACAAAVPAAAQAPDLERYVGDAADAADVARLERGELIEVDGARFDDVIGERALEEGDSALVLFTVDAPAPAVWQVLTDFERQPEFMPHMTGVERGPRDSARRAHVCFQYEILWIDSTNCFFVESDSGAGTLVGSLDADNSDERLRGVNYFWHVGPWRGERLLLAYYEELDYSGALAAFGHEAFVGPKRTGKAVRERIRSIAAGGEIE